VQGIDAAPLPAGSGGWLHVTADLASFAASLELVRDADAVVHIAAIPRPTGRSAGEVFHTNVAACYNVVEATRLARIPRLVYASSFSVLGYPFGQPFVAPRLLPIDESHPPHAQDAYGLSKWLGEEIVEAAVRGGTMSAVSLRMPWVQSSQTFGEQIGPRRETAESVRDLWSYIDVRDAAEAFLLALEWQGSGHQRLYVAADDTYLLEETQPALHKWLPQVPLAKPLPGFAALIDHSLAGATLGFMPRFSWRDYADEDIA
jgi:nucleoside-diphosphate-sugar epimerase